MLLANPLLAEVVFDGTLGPGGALSGDFDIPDSFGTQVGPNLFHSFSTFNVNTGESATFTSSFGGVTDNVIGRVTGTSVTTIDGLLASSIPGAAVWLVNPNGVVFGDNVSLAVPGSLHATTADYLLLEDGGRFDATNVGNTVLTMANPSAFGFLGPAPAPISVGTATLAVAAGETLSLVCGNIDLAGSTLLAPGGQINLVSMGSAGEVQVSDPDANRANLGGFGDIALNSSTVAADGTQGGEIYILGGQFFGSFSAVTSHTSGAQDGGTVRIDVDDLTISDFTGIETHTFGDGAAGSIEIDAVGTVAIVPGVSGTGARIQSIAQNGTASDSGSVSITASDFDMQFSTISIFTLGTGQGGVLSMDIENSLSVMGGFGSALANNSIADANAGSVIIDAGNIDFFGGSILVRAFGDGDAGQISIIADNLNMANGTQFGAGAFGLGVGGVINVDVTDTITMSDDIGFPTAMVSGSANGVGGDITVHSRILNILEGAELSNAAFGFANAGDINVTADEGIFISGRAGVFTGIFSNTFFAGDAGNINVTTPELQLTDGGSIQAGALAGSFGNGGSIILDVGDLVIDSGNSFVSTQTSAGGAGGDIVINAATITMAGGPATFDGIFAGANSSGDGGSILINTGSLAITDGANVAASTFGDGSAGGLTISATGSITLDARSDPNTGIFNNAFATGQAGSIDVDASDLTISGLASIQASTVATGNAGAITIAAGNLTLADGGSIAVVTTAAGNAGTIDIDIAGTLSANRGDLSQLGFGNIASSTSGPGDGGTITVSADRIVIDEMGLISARTSLDGAGGDVTIEGRIIDIAGGSTVSANASGAGNAGTVLVIAIEDLTVTGASIETDSVLSAGGNIGLDVGHTLFLNEGATVSAAAGGVTASDGGGNIAIAEPVFVVMRESEILATANAGNGGNIGIRTGSFVVDTESVIDASSQTGLDGRITIDTVNNVYGSVLLLEAPALEVPDVITQKCVAAAFQDRSSLVVEQHESLIWSPEDWVPSPYGGSPDARSAAARPDECRFTLTIEHATDAS